MPNVVLELMNPRDPGSYALWTEPVTSPKKVEFFNPSIVNCCVRSCPYNILSFNKCYLHTCCVSETLLGTGQREVKIPLPVEAPWKYTWTPSYIPPSHLQDCEELSWTSLTSHPSTLACKAMLMKAVSSSHMYPWILEMCLLQVSDGIVPCI